MANAASPPAVVVPRCQLRCSGTGTDRACAGNKLAVVCGGHGRILCCAQRDEIYLMTDSLVVASMVGGSGHGAGASPAGFRNQIDHLDDVYADEGLQVRRHVSTSARGKSAHSRLSVIACALVRWSCWGRLHRRRITLPNKRKRAPTRYVNNPGTHNPGTHVLAQPQP